MKRTKFRFTCPRCLTGVTLSCFNEPPAPECSCPKGKKTETMILTNPPEETPVIENETEPCDTLGHDDRTTYEGPDGRQWECRRCGAEGWDEPADGAVDQLFEWDVKPAKPRATKTVHYVHLDDPWILFRRVKDRPMAHIPRGEAASPEEAKALKSGSIRAMCGRYGSRIDTDAGVEVPACADCAKIAGVPIRSIEEAVEEEA